MSRPVFRHDANPDSEGRGFTEADAAMAASAPVAVISETTAKHIWPGENPIGKAIQLGGREEENRGRSLWESWVTSGKRGLMQV